MAEDGYPVKLHIYDLSQGMARQLSSTILGKAIDAIWHTGVVVYGKEYFFGGGIQKDRPGRTPYGTPVRVEDLGVTHVPREIFEDFLREIGPRYTPATYSLLSNNCNNFSDEAAQFLVGSRIPGYILELPNEVKNSPIGALIMPMIQGLETTLRAGAAPQPPQFKSAPAAAAAAAAETQSSSDSIHVRPKSAATDQTDADDNGSRIPAAAASSAPVVAESEVSTSAAVDKTDAEEAADHGRRIPPAAEPSAPVVAEVSTAAAMDKMDADKAADNGSRIPPAVQPAPVEAAAAALAAPVVAEVSTAAAEPAPAAPAPAAAIAAPVVAEVSTSAVAAAAAEPPEDPLREAKNRVREEIKREFAVIMATGAAQAGEAAALATRRVMERHGVRRAAAAAGGVQRG